MQLRWIVVVALWTLLSGPVFAPRPSPKAPAAKSPTMTVRPTR